MQVRFLFFAFATGAWSFAPVPRTKSAKTAKGNYVVVLKSINKGRVASHMERANAVLGVSGTGSLKTFDIGGMRGYSVRATTDAINTLAESEDIAYIEPDQIFTISSPAPSPQSNAKRNVQANAPWNLARISHRARGSTDYVFNPTSGTYIYELDTGVKISHRNFQGRATWGFNAVGGTNEDDNGHGTHVAGTASSQTYGVARFAGIVSVKVLGAAGSGITSGVISGINWAVQDMQTKGHVGKATAVLAIGGPFSAALNNAVAAASNAGLFLAVAAGSSNTDNSGSSPGSEPSVCTVGATTINDARLSSSNYGPGIDIWAPGSQVTSLWISSNTSVNTLSGTSSAAAHIAGLGAYFLALEGPRGAVALCERLREIATRDVLTGIPPGRRICLRIISADFRSVLGSKCAMDGYRDSIRVVLHIKLNYTRGPSRG